ncbi:MAG: glycosyltransferase, partial [Angelakisella sp.]
HVWLVDDSENREASRQLSCCCVSSQATLMVLARNSGQQNAILCGLRAAAPCCDAVATMDDDLQHPPELLPLMYKKLSSDCDLIYALAAGGRKPFYRRAGSFFRDILFDLLLCVPKGMRVGSFRIMSASVARAAAAHEYKFFYFSASALPAAKGIANLSYPAIARPYGKSGYSFGKLCRIYLGIVKTYTRLGRALFRPEKGIGYEVAEIFEGADES